MTWHLGDGKRVILSQSIEGSVRAIRAVRNIRVFLMETSVVADRMVVVAYIEDILIAMKSFLEKHHQQLSRLFQLLMGNNMCFEIV